MLSVVTVNYNSSSLVRACLSSLVSALGKEPFEFVVVDSGSRFEDVQELRALDGRQVKVILRKENVGYARGINEGVRNTTGDVILITNPDVLYQPGSIRAMLAAFSDNPRCGAVGPRTWWDSELTFLLPFSELITPGRIFRTELMRASPRLKEMILCGWIRKSLAYWESERPVVQEMLPGASIMTKREVFERVGGLEEAYPLYFEDADWCLRVRKAGLLLYMVPEAKIIHYHNQSAGQERGPSQKKFDYSSTVYFNKHFKTRRSLLGYALRLLPQRGDPATKGFDELGVLAEPPSFSFRDDSKKLFLVSPVDLMIPSAGAIFESTTLRIPEELWGHLGEERFFARAFELDRLTPCGAWSWVKRRAD